MSRRCLEQKGGLSCDESTEEGWQVRPESKRVAEVQSRMVVEFAKETSATRAAYETAGLMIEAFQAGPGARLGLLDRQAIRWSSVLTLGQR